MEHFIAAFSRDIETIEFIAILVSSGSLSAIMLFALNLMSAKREELVNLIDSMEDEN